MSFSRGGGADCTGVIHMERTSSKGQFKIISNCHSRQYNSFKCVGQELFLHFSLFHLLLIILLLAIMDQKPWEKNGCIGNMSECEFACTLKWLFCPWTSQNLKKLLPPFETLWLLLIPLSLTLILRNRSVDITHIPAYTPRAAHENSIGTVFGSCSLGGGS